MIFSAKANWFVRNSPQAFVEAAKYGFKAAEYLNWQKCDLKEYKKVFDEYNIVSTCLNVESKNPDNMAKIAWTHGLAYADTEEAMVEAFKETVEAAVYMGVPNIVVTTGNERKDVSHRAQREQIVHTLSRLAPIAEDAGITAVLEPLNILVNHAGHFLYTSKDGFDMVREVNRPNFRLLFDIYHQQVTEGNLIRNITENIDLIGHFHIADNPGRKEPGTGEVDYINVLRAIKATGYNKYLAFECGQTVETPQLVENLKPYLAIAD